MLSPKLKKILSGIMIAGDILLGAVFFADLLTGIDPGIDLFLLAFLATDALLSLDYIGRLSKEQKEQEKQKLYEARQQAVHPDRLEDRKMAQDIASGNEALDYIDELSPDELAELLQNRQEEELEALRKR